MTSICKKRKVVVLKDGRVVRRYASLQDFYAGEQLDCNIATASKRISGCVDGWLLDGCVARYKGDEKKAGRMLRTEKVREQKGGSERMEMRRELAETEAKIEAIYKAYDDGELTMQERHEKLGWLEHHRLVLRQRLKKI